ncbi:hypothetical protein [Deinococcus sp. Marseille-Q6407]|uniref:hypothetical protein n=1 Tax=Deinococcus sp. Marseille-Q6407 TaxID=2969223 RepID=UPI0021C16EBF|nr:hypothetical protein [Deinococcus sp. Marseille-Q6407]
MNISDIQQAFDAAYTKDPRDGLTINHSSEEGHFRVEVRHQDTDGNLRGFDVVAEPTPAEERSADDIGQAMAQVVEQELAYGQLPARGDDGEFRRIVV